MTHVGDARPDCIETLKRTDKCTSRKHLDLNTSPGRGADCLREPNRARVKARGTFWPVGHHFELSKALSDRGRRKARGLLRRQPMIQCRIEYPAASWLSHFAPLLRARLNERPRHRAAKKPNELAPLQLTKLHPLRQTKVGA